MQIFIIFNRNEIFLSTEFGLGGILNLLSEKTGDIEQQHFKTAPEKYLLAYDFIFQN